MTLYKWSQTASSDASADSTINWAEGQAPSSVNDSARAMMAATAKYRDDIAGAIVTSGTSTAYTVSSYQVFDTLAHMSGQMIAFTPHATNGATVTLNVDTLGPKPLRTAPGVELLAGIIAVETQPLIETAGPPFLVHPQRQDGGKPVIERAGGGRIVDHHPVIVPEILDHDHAGSGRDRRLAIAHSLAVGDVRATFGRREEARDDTDIPGQPATFQHAGGAFQ